MDQGFPAQHTTTTVTTTTTTTQPTIRFDSSYARTVPGVLKIVQVVSQSRLISIDIAFVLYQCPFDGAHL